MEMFDIKFDSSFVGKVKTTRPSLNDMGTIKENPHQLNIKLK